MTVIATAAIKTRKPRTVKPRSEMANLVLDIARLSRRRAKVAEEVAGIDAMLLTVRRRLAELAMPDGDAPSR